MMCKTMASDDGGERLGPSEFLAYRILEGLKAQSDRQITRSKYLKLCCIADHYLNENGVDISFPRYWYRYGEIASENDFNNAVHKSMQARGFAGRQYRPSDEVESSAWVDQQVFEEDLYEPASGLGDDDFDVDDDTRREIVAAVRWVVHKLGKKDVSDIRRFQYRQYAPHQFIRAYSDLRYQLENTEHNQVRFGKSGSQQDASKMMKHLLDEMMMTYPEDRFERMHSLFLRWDDTMRLLLEDGRSYDELEQVLDSFIEAFSQVELRFAFHSNLPESRLDMWEEERQEVLDDYREELREIRDGVLLGRGTSETFDALSNPYNESMKADIERELTRD